MGTGDATVGLKITYTVWLLLRDEANMAALLKALDDAVRIVGRQCDATTHGGVVTIGAWEGRMPDDHETK